MFARGVFNPQHQDWFIWAPPWLLLGSLGPHQHQFGVHKWGHQRNYIDHAQIVGPYFCVSNVAEG